MIQQIAEERQEIPSLKLDSLSRSNTLKYIIHAPITVSNDTELAVIANSGNGSANNPYIISGWNITNSVTNGIFITKTTKHFRIENCLIEGSNNHSIHIEYVSPGTNTISNNICNYSNGSGIYLNHSGSSTITSNICKNNNDGI